MQQDGASNSHLFLVCGLGNLGQSCIALLKEFGAVVNAIEITENLNWQNKLIIVGSIQKLRCVEHGVLNRKNWLLQVEKVSSPEAVSKGAEIISHISGCNIAIAEKLMNLLPQTLPVELYKHQAQRLANELYKINKVERGIIDKKNWFIQIERTLTNDAVFNGAAVITRISGCDMATARSVISQLPQTLPCPLYKHQAQRLVQELVKAQVVARVERQN
ncbi:hypothetical protein NIES4071_67240 [Calothrix sp. NIES-4071]|nr:hypothetical protein NIES4071_67240 [Calothrix sp. NIES-4071]BAZ61002.1 hypothetical protein NIES4105_67200 [Calothrix sp. NIES-4105]